MAACHALGLYEALECPDQNTTAYHWHRAACCELVRLRGAKAHREGLAHQLFVNVRIFAVSYYTRYYMQRNLTIVRYWILSNEANEHT